MVNRRIGSRRIYDGRIIRLRLDEVELPNGRRAEREIIEHPGAAAIVPLDAEGRLHLVSQYRDAVAGDLLEIPAGKLKRGEDPAECARRELREELGLETGAVTHLATFYSTPGFCDELMHVFLAEELEAVAAELDREEFITAELRPLDPIAPLLEEIEDGKSIAGILLAREAIAQRDHAAG